MMQFIAAADGAPGRIDPQHDRLDLLILLDVVELGAGEPLPAHDRSGDIDNRHLGGCDPGERMVFLHDSCIPLKILGRRPGTRQGHQQ